MRHLFPAVFATFAVLAALPAAADAIADGESVYKTKTCVACHGIRGGRPVLSYPALAGQNEAYLLTQLHEIRDGKRVGSVDTATGRLFVQGMVDIMHLVTEDDLANVAKYLAAQTPGKPKPLDPPPTPELLEAGAKAYKALGCQACHGKDGSKPIAKTYPYLAGLGRDYLIRQMTDIRAKARNSGQTRLMVGIIAKADDAEIEAIATWLSQIDRSAAAQ